MPILWRYVVFSYLRVFFLSLFSMIAILLTLQFGEIAHFAALGGGISCLVQFVLFQIPYMLPIAVPISCLIASILLFMRLSRSHELTAFRVGGFSLFRILAPLLFVSSVLVLVNFYVVSELATLTHRMSVELKNHLRRVNPLLLLHNKHLMRSQGGFFQVMGQSELGESASDAILALQDESGIRVLVAKKLKNGGGALQCEDVAMLTSCKTPFGDDAQVIENVRHSEIASQDFLSILRAKKDHFGGDLLPLLTLISHTSDFAKIAKEIMRRISVALSAFSFTLMGAAFGIAIRRGGGIYGVVSVFVLSLLYITAYFCGDRGSNHLFEAFFFFFGSHILICVLSLLALKRVSLGYAR